MKDGTIAAQMARLTGASPAAVSKWVNGRTQKIKAVHAFKLAHHWGVDAEWLATGRGNPQRIKAANIVRDAAVAMPTECLDLVRKYQRLPEEMRLSIRTLIEGYASGNNQSGGYKRGPRLDGGDRRGKSRK